MKKIIQSVLLASACIMMLSCNNTDMREQAVDQQSEQEAIDSLAFLLNRIDSISYTGRLAHLDVYEIGKIKGVEISVKKMIISDDTLSYINLRKDCGGQYYYSWEDAHLLSEECTYLISAIRSMANNTDRQTDHEERYSYLTKDNINVMSYATKGKPWVMQLSVNPHKPNSSITLNSNDIEMFIELIEQAQVKLAQI